MDSMNQPSETRIYFGEIEEFEDEVERRFDLFNNFGIIPNPPQDHLFFKYNKDSYWVLSESVLANRIEREWNFLKKNLPNSIFVRVYESSMDLMRVAIVGPPCTPYHHALFFFDIIFPKNYPSTPPKLRYHSYGLELNPKLHEGGKVCLCTLDTAYERIIHEWCACNIPGWNPEKSNILHLLFAIGLISNAKPYSSNGYNEKVFKLSCVVMIRMLKEPPTDFEDFVKGHFRRRAHPVLLKFRQEYDDKKDQLVIDLFTNLYEAFEKNGTYCRHHLCFLKPKNENREEARVTTDTFTEIADRLKSLAT